MSQTSQETYKSRLRQYKRREQMVIWVGAGLAGLLAITTGDAFNEAPAMLKAIEVSLLVISGACLALARIKFEWEATQIQRKIEDGEVTEQDPLPTNLQDFPKVAEGYWNVSLFLIPLAGIVMLICFWWTVFATDK